MPGGSAVAMLYEFKQPGPYVYISHNLIEAILLGAAAHVRMERESDDNLMEEIKGGGSHNLTMQCAG